MKVFWFLGVFVLSGVTGINLQRGVCPKGSFQCATSVDCVQQRFICDLVEDCPDGSDEVDCDDEGKDLFTDHLFRKNLAAQSDDTAREGCSFSGYKGGCRCRDRDLICHGNVGNGEELQEIPTDLPQESISLLNFEHYNFTALSEDFLKALPSSIDKLNFAHCRIGELHPRSFYKLNITAKLQLGNNRIRTVPSRLFPRENLLEDLYLAYNRIDEINPAAFEELRYLTELDLRGNEISLLDEEVFRPLKRLIALHLQSNRIRYIDGNSFPPLNVGILSLVGNRIESIEKESLRGLAKLEHLFLTDNKLVHLINGTFYNLTQLNVLNLDVNMIERIEHGVFVHVTNLTSLRMDHNRFRTLDKKVLEPLVKLEHIYFDQFEMCDSAPSVPVCEPKGDGISSHEHLLDNPVLRASVWITAAIGCTGNLIVLLGRILAPTNNVVHSLYLRNLAFSDLLMGIYLFIIAAADQYYRRVYLRHQYSWRHSYMCSFCGFLSTLSCESSVLILSLVTWDRFVSVTQPLARKQPSERAATLTLVVLWTVAAGVALAPLSKGYFGDEFYGNNGVCLPLHIHEPYAKGWEYSAAMFMLVNTFALAFISYAYLRMINEIKASGVACRSTRQSQDRDKVAQRFGIIVLTDSLCWVPVIIVKIVALSGHPVHEKLYAWLAIFILPINSALNPVLYTLTTTVFKKQMRKVINSMVYKRRRVDHQHSASESGLSLSLGVLPIGSSSRRILSYRGTQNSSVTTSKNSWKKPPTAV